MAQTAIVEGKEVKVGDWVGFKCDIEQSGRIAKIEKNWRGSILHLVSEDGFEGGYIGGETTHEEEAERCWL